MNGIKRDMFKEVSKYALPLQFDGLVLIPAWNISRINEVLETFKGKWEEGRNSFLDAYQTLQDEFSFSYPQYYQPDRYPSPQAVSERFAFKWSWFAFENNFIGLSKEELEQERQRLMGQVVEVVDFAHQTVKGEILSGLNKIKDQFDRACEAKEGQEKITLTFLRKGVSKRTVEFIQGLWKGVFEPFTFHKELSEIMNGKIVPYFEGIDEGQFSDVVYQAQVAQKAAELGKELSSLADVKAEDLVRDIEW